MTRTTPRFAVLGTAGHIDHGKTALVRLLTGTDTDRLKEEKARGISIDLGFAHLDLPGGISCGVVDVPGHERFVKNMLAGACGVDAMLLVIAADEGVMPQTREHLDILDLLGVRRGVVALTKTDLVEPDWLDLAVESVREYLEERGFGSFPILPVSARTGEGKEALLVALAEVLGELEERPGERFARLPVDRAFVVEGFGTVVTGTLWQGVIRPADRLVVEPGHVETRVRNVQVHGESVGAALAGQRTAVALAGVPREAVPRGHWLLTPGALTPSHMIDVRLRVLADAPKGLRHRQRVRFHLGASEVLGRVALLEGDAMAPGETAFAQIRLEEVVVADRGDRFVLRSYSPARAVAGGKVILPVAPKRRRGHPSTIEELRREESGSLEDRVLAALDGLAHGGGPAEVARVTGLAPETASGVLAVLVADGRAMQVEETLLVSGRVLRHLVDGAASILEQVQGDNPLRWGMSRGELKSRLGVKLPAPLFERVLAELTGAGRAVAREDHLRLGGDHQELSAEMQARVDRIAAILEQAGLAPPNPKELQALAGCPVQEILEHLTFRGEAAKVSPELYLHRLHLQRILDWLAGFFREQDELSVADLREGLGMSRKYSVPILEFLDRQGWTRRVGDLRRAGRRWQTASDS